MIVPECKIPLADEWLRFEDEVLGERPLTTGSVAEVRGAYDRISNILRSHYPQPKDYPVAEDAYFTGSGLGLRVYTPIETPEDPTAALPLGVFAHGGGHVSGGAWKSSMDDRMCRYISQHAGVILASVDFRRAPESPVPAQVEDCYEAFKWCHAHAAKLNADPDKLFAIGTSLGGGVAFGVALKLMDEGLGDMVKGVVSIAPSLLHPSNVPRDFQGMYKAYDQTWNGTPMQDGESMMTFFKHNGSDEEANNPYVFPCLHPRVKDLPPVYQAVCEADPVRDDSTVMRYLLNKNCVPNTRDFYKALPHYFWIFPSLPSSDRFHQNIAKGTRWVVENMATPKPNGWLADEVILSGGELSS